MGLKTTVQHGSAYVRDRARIPGPAGVVGGKRRGRTKSGKGGRGFISRQASSPRLMQIGYSVQRGARRASSSLVPRLAPRGFPVRREWWVESGGDERRAEKEGGGSFPGRHLLLASCRSGTRFSGGRGALPRLLSPASRRVDSRAGGDGGAGSGRDGGSARCEKAGAARGAKKGTGGAGSPFPRWVASLPHIARIPGPARNVGARRPYPTSIRFPVQRGWWGGSGMQKGTSTGYGRRCALASARGGRARKNGGVRWRAHG